MIGGVLTKARRGELCPLLPIGFVYDDENTVVLNPDRQVQELIRPVFSFFRRTGSAYALVRHFRDKGPLFPSRLLFGPNRHELIWVPLQRSTIMRVLDNPQSSLTTGPPWQQSESTSLQERTGSIRL